MHRFIDGEDRMQQMLLPHCLEDYVGEEDPVRVIEVFIEELDLAALGFSGVTPAATGRPGYHPSTLLKIYLYGCLNRRQSSRRLEREAQRATTDRRTPVRDPQGVDGRHPLPDPDPRQGPNRDEPPRSGLQLQANDHDLRCGAADGGDQNLIASLKPHASVCLPASRSLRLRNTARRPPPLMRFSTASGKTGGRRSQDELPLSADSGPSSIDDLPAGIDPK